MWREPFEVAVLAGGRSARMGRDKAALALGGRTLLARQVALAWALGPAAVWVSGRAQAELGDLSARGLPDDAPGLGPLGGVATVLGRVRAPHVLVVAVDMPALTAALLGRLLARRRAGVGAVPRTRRGWEPAAAVYPRALAPAATAALAAGRRALRGLVEDGVRAGRLVALEVGADEERALRSWNTPEDVLDAHPALLAAQQPPDVVPVAPDDDEGDEEAGPGGEAARRAGEEGAGAADGRPGQ